MTDRPIIDLRSDTVTLPSVAMRRAMAEAPVGDDVYGEDPSVNRLQEMAAAATGKEAALFVPSGTMGNLLAVMVHCNRGDEAIVGSEAHILHHEMASPAGIAGVQLRPVLQDARGRMRHEDVEAAIRPPGSFAPRTALLCLENTHNRCSGAVLTPEETDALAAVARAAGVAAVHIDGARIFNAALACGAPVDRLAAAADTVGFCFSKGLGAPVGSIFCGPAPVIDRARKMRRSVGGAMRQAGILAAAGIYALEHMVDRLADDHANAKALACGLAALPMVDIDVDAIETNIVIFRVDGDWRAFMRALKDRGVLCSLSRPGYVRMVTHYGIEAPDIDEAISRARDAAAAFA